MRKSYIKNLTYNIFTNFGKRYITVDYDRNGEHNRYTLGDVPLWVQTELDVRDFINGKY